MIRMVCVPALAALCLTTAPALAQSGAMTNDTFQSQDPMVRLQTDCGAPDLAEASIDACLERARVLDETNPSPSLDTLTAKLEQRASQSFNPNGVDQGVHRLPPSAKTANSDSESQAPPPKALQPLDDPSGADASDPKMDFKDMDNDDLPPVEDDSKIDDGPPPKTITDDAPPPGDPVGASDDDKGPHR